MDKKEKQAFVQNITRNISNQICGLIHNDKIPDNWDGIELREYLHILFSRESYFGKSDSFSKRKKRYKDFRTDLYNIL